MGYLTRAFGTAMTDRAPDISRGHRAGVRSSRVAVFGGALLIVVLLFVVLGPFLWPLAPDAINTSVRNQGGSWAHPMGTDQLGRDMFARVLVGGRISLSVGFVAMVLSVGLGTFVGVLSGYFRKLDGILMRTTDLFLSLPLLPLLLVAVMLFREPLNRQFGPETGIFILIVVAIGATSWMSTARIVRGEVIGLRERDFVLAARSSGTRRRAMITRHILPNVMSPIVVSATLGIANAIITESALSFLGLGFPPDFATWGRLLNDGTVYLTQYPGRALWPGTAITMTVLAVTYLGEGVRDALHPRSASVR